MLQSVDAQPVPQALAELGGIAHRADLLRRCGRPAVDAALASGELVSSGRRYVSPQLDAARAAAVAVSGVLSRRSAALDRGWAVRTAPELVEVTLPKNRTVAATRTVGLDILRATLGPDDVDGVRTSADRTLLDCSRSLPFPEALAVADSALQEGYPSARLLALGRDARGPGSAQVRHVAAAADGRAANPFESSRRATCLEVEGLDVVPQLDIHDPHWLGRPDLTDVRLRLVLEADSFAWHGGRAALARDARRYNALVVAGWWVLRFSWEEVICHPARVRSVLEAAVRERGGAPCRCSAA